uniref:Granulins domain-containing protein n=1 Tax=Meloidogyne hapla TaxID=6305 RepID=A0A1I8BDU2_MELHA
MKIINLFYLFSLYLIFILICSSRADEEVICPDLQSKCPGGTTCCTLDSGVFGCCPLPKAVCCSDHLHCCPENNRCDVEHQLCLHTDEDGIITSQPLSRKVPSTHIHSKISKNQNQEVICPDGKHSCPAHHTCCPINRKQFWNYGCCPAEKAVCCSDHLHCCPHGTECDISEARCLVPQFFRETEIKEFPQLSIQHKKQHSKRKNLRKVKAQTMKPSVQLCGFYLITKELSVCPVLKKCCHHLPKPFDGNSKVISCCPYKDGNCCKYSNKCCPKGYECTDNKCISVENKKINYYESQEEREQTPILTSETSEYPSLSPIPLFCPDSSICTSKSDTCCPRYENNELIGYDCCPLSKANCCSDRTCCPYGYSCTKSLKNRESSCKQMKTSELIAQLFLH